MMAADALKILASANLAAGVAVVLVLLMRIPVRRAFGSRAAYGLWLIVPLAALAILLPPRTITRIVTAPPPVSAAPAEPAATPAPPVMLHDLPLTAPAPASDPKSLLFLGWALGSLLSLALLSLRQHRFLLSLGKLKEEGRIFRAEARGVGPAVVGALFPRIVLPADFENRYSAAERATILAHEETHLKDGHASANALIALIQCLCWFNPLIHVAAFFVRVDQEMACDAAVLTARPQERRLYAEALLKTQLGGRAPPFGCYWPAEHQHPLKTRIAMLKHPLPGAVRRAVGTGLAVAVSLAAALAAWASQTPRTIYVFRAPPAARHAAPITQGVSPGAAPLIVTAAAAANPLSDTFLPRIWLDDLKDLMTGSADDATAETPPAVITAAMDPAPTGLIADRAPAGPAVLIPVVDMTPVDNPDNCGMRCDLALADEMPAGPMGISSIALLTDNGAAAPRKPSPGLSPAVLRPHNGIPSGMAVEISGALRLPGAKDAAPLRMVVTPSTMNAAKSPALDKLGVRTVSLAPQIVDGVVHLSSYVRTNDNLYSPHATDFHDGESRSIDLGGGATLTLRVTIRAQNMEEFLADQAAASGLLAAAAGPPMTPATRNARISIPGFLAVDAPPQPSRTRLASITGKADLLCTVADRRLEDCRPMDSSDGAVTDAAMVTAMYLEMPPDSSRPRGTTVKVPFNF